jgi:palmitoyl transferase
MGSVILTRFFLFCLLCLSSWPSFAVEATSECQKWPSWSKHACHRLHQIWEQGHNELFFSGYAWHNRYRYDQDRIGRYNELAWGGGLGKGFYDEDGDWHGLAAIAFLDSHKNLEPAAGYTFLKVYHANDYTRLGAGFALLVTSRPDIFHSIPFPGILPWFTFNYRQASVCLSYVPGPRNVGNVLFILGKWTFE